jgi:hypothetical protein
LLKLKEGAMKIHRTLEFNRDCLTDAKIVYTKFEAESIPASGTRSSKLCLTTTRVVFHLNDSKTRLPQTLGRGPRTCLSSAVWAVSKHGESGTGLAISDACCFDFIRWR